MAVGKGRAARPTVVKPHGSGARLQRSDRAAEPGPSALWVRLRRQREGALGYRLRRGWNMHPGAGATGRPPMSEPARPCSARDGGAARPAHEIRRRTYTPDRETDINCGVGQ